MKIIDNSFAKSPQGKIGLQFAQALVGGRFEIAHHLLAPILQQEYSGDRLKSEYESMLAYTENSPVTELEVIIILDDWQTKQAGDLGWAYVSLAMEGYGEAIAVVVTQDLLVREIEWGRP